MSQGSTLAFGLTAHRDMYNFNAPYMKPGLQPSRNESTYILRYEIVRWLLIVRQYVKPFLGQAPGMSLLTTGPNRFLTHTELVWWRIKQRTLPDLC